MTYLPQDFLGFALGTLIAPLLFYLPGFGLLRLVMPRTVPSTIGQQFGWAAILAIAILPTVDVLLVRFAGMTSAIAMNVSLGIYGAPTLQRGLRHLSIKPIFYFSAILWWLVCAVSYVDVDIGDRLYQSLTAYDMVKHAAVVEQIARQGIPFTDPFFARNGIAAYYHYFYVWAAEVRWLSGFTISAPMAFAATAFWTGMAVPSLLWRISADANFIRPRRGQRVAALAILFCFIAGADLLVMVLRILTTGEVGALVDHWNVEVRFLATSVIWVPHHISAVISGWAGMLLVIRAREYQDAPCRRLAVAAGIAFSTMFGCSIWIAITLAPLLVVWTFIRLRHRDTILVLAGCVAVACALPQIADLVQGRMPGDFPIAFQVRYFSFILYGDTAPFQVGRVLLLPINYALEFGLFALGAVVYWRTKAADWRDPQPVRAMILASAATSLLIASFFKSAIIYNDLGWRSILFAQLAAMLWTLHLAQSTRSVRTLSPVAGTLLFLGVAANIWDVAGYRIIRPPLFSTYAMKQNSFPQLDYAVRSAHVWADAQLPEGTVLQQNPGIDARSLNFGMYGRHWPAIADKEAMLFGASAQAVEQRMALVMPIFDRSISREELLQRATSSRVDYLFFTFRDPVWKANHGPPSFLKCAYRTPLLCIGRVQRMK
ncbi:hypothetical protein BH11PSE5_BH11PSE5_16730 [soil metagenome]